MGEDDTLVARCRRGDRDAWEELFERHYEPASRFVFQSNSDLSREDVEEVVQEAFLSVIRNIGSFKGGSRLQTWIFRIASNKARDLRESRHAAKRGGGKIPFSLDQEREDGLPPPDPPDQSARPDAALISMEQMEIVRQGIDQLGDACREVIELRYFADLSYGEIADALKLNPKTVSSRLSKCLDRLEAVLGSKAEFSV